MGKIGSPNLYTFSLEELKHALHQSKPSSPGPETLITEKLYLEAVWKEPLQSWPDVKLPTQANLAPTPRGGKCVAPYPL